MELFGLVFNKRVDIRRHKEVQKVKEFGIKEINIYTSYSFVYGFSQIVLKIDVKWRFLKILKTIRFCGWA